jgi:hypothetical protein
VGLFMPTHFLVSGLQCLNLQLIGLGLSRLRLGLSFTFSRSLGNAIRQRTVS